jgi:hypothetical protein
LSLEWFFSLFANFDKSQSFDVSQAFSYVTLTGFSSATGIGWVSSKRFRLMSSTSSGDISAVFWTTVGFRARFDTTVTDTWHAFSFIFVPDLTRTDLVTQVINTVGTTVFVFDAFHDLASATGIDGGGGVASGARDFVQSWTITGASAVFDVFQAFVNFSIFWTSPIVLFFVFDDRRVFARANWIGNFNWFWTWWIFDWTCSTFAVVTASVS